jgi:hypothetical protein
MISGSIQRGFAVYVPLVSLWKDDSQIVGDFETLVEFAKWAKSCRIGQIHIHIETMEHHLIDPVHAAVKCGPSNYELTEIRDAKLAVLSRLFERADPNDRAFVAFQRCTPWVVEACNTQFERWVQFFLFTQYQWAFQEIMELGVRLITDFVLDLEPCHSALLPCLHTMATLANGIRIIGLEHWLQPPSTDLLYLLFGAHADFVIRGFFHVSEAGAEQVVRTKQAIATRLASVESRVLRRSLERKLNWFAEFNPNKNKEFFAGLASMVPASVIVDPRATQVLSLNTVVTDLHLVPSACRPADHSWVTPGWLSPDLISAFPMGEPHDAMHAHLAEQVKTEALGVTVYLNDLEVMIGHSPANEAAPVSVQRVKDYCRFQYPMSLEEIVREEDMTNSIRAMLQSCNRAA